MYDAGVMDLSSLQIVVGDVLRSTGKELVFDQRDSCFTSL